ncbi:MAG: hypothetical protein EP333_09770 [Bacteroidetes bacterium]|nr:MAG: hypothetical protein EP333_09770 [Bacteroidota bacterium]
MVKWLLLNASFVVLFNVVGQTYSPDRAKFVKEFQKVINEVGDNEQRDYAKDKLPVLLLESNKISDTQFSALVQTCNLLEAKRFKVVPEIYNYVFSVTSLVENGQGLESYNAFQAAASKLLESRNSKKFTDFIEMTSGYFSKDMIAASSNFDWFYVGGTFNFEFDVKSVILFEGGDLICRVKSNSAQTRGDIIDSVVISNTAGEYDPALKKWIGTGGKVTWEKVELDPKSTFALIETYEVSLKKPDLRVDTVTLTTPYFSSPIKGMLTDRAFKINREEDKMFPQFLSFNNRLFIPEIAEGVDYTGGFALKGGSFIGAGTPKEPASITMKRNGLPFIKSRAQQVLVDKNKLLLSSASTTIYFGNGDSLYHPSLEFTFDRKTNIVQLSRPKTGIGQSPFVDSYHQLDIYVERVSWEVNTDLLDFTYDFGTSRDQRFARFESRSYFDAQVYDRLQGYSSVHPLVGLHNYAYKYDEQVLTEGKAATAIGLTVEQAKPLLLELSSQGFINYDLEAKTVVLNKKLETFVKAKAGTIDYDNIVFRSDLRPKELAGYSPQQIEEDEYLKSVKAIYDKQNEERRLMKKFGSMDLANFDLYLEAVDNVVLSTEKNVAVFPENYELTIKKNRDFNFSGWINAGKLELSANAAQFAYNEYKFRVLESDEALFRVRPLRKEDGLKSIPMVSSLSGIIGEIYIDDPSNRSGRNPKITDFPKIKCTSRSKIFYNSDEIIRGIYDSTRFYYTVYPFDLDSLNDFVEQKLRIDGELVSAGIFPTIKEPVKIMPDYSFGFVQQAPEGGYDFYGSNAKYDNKIVLSHNGLQGAGTIDFVYSTSESKAFTFLPDSTVGIAKFVNKGIETGIEFPPVFAEEAFVTYIPGQRMLKASSLPKKEIQFFDDNDTKLKGTAIVTPEGMRGFGLMTFLRATMISDDYRFKRYDIDADTASFTLKNDNVDLTEDPMAFKTDNVKSHVSFKDRQGEFNSNEGESVVYFPVNQYLCKMDKFTWFMDDDAIEMERQKDRDLAISTGVDLLGPNFFSQHPKQDTLQFMAPRAKFSLKEKTIFCEKVPYIDVADARLYPDSMKVNIRKKAKMDKFVNSTIVANYITRYHNFVNAEIEVLARRDYKATGDYVYYDMDSLKTLIPMSSIGLDTAYQTIAYGNIEQAKSFKLSPYFDYYGELSIKAANPLLYFKGATRITHDCEKFDRNWMSFSAELDPKNIQIPVKEVMTDLAGDPITAGIVWRDSPVKDSIALYPTFLSAKVKGEDPVLFTSSGVLQYNIGAQEFQIGSKDKLINMSEPGNFLALHTGTCSMNGIGTISLGMDYGDMDVASVGTVNYNQETGETMLNLTMRFTANMDASLFEGMAKRINEIEALKPMTFNTCTLEEAIVEWDGTEEADKLKSKYTIDNEVKKLPKSVEKSITISGIRMSYYANPGGERGLITDLESAILVNMYSTPVMKYVPFKAYFGQNYSGGAEGDKFSFFINIPGGRDYYFDYKMTKKDGVLKIRSGDEDFNNQLNALKEEKRKSKNFLYEPTSNTVLQARFLELFSR